MSEQLAVEQQLAEVIERMEFASDEYGHPIREGRRFDTVANEIALEPEGAARLAAAILAAVNDGRCPPIVPEGIPPEIELASLWSNEGDDMTFVLEGPSYIYPGSVALFLTSDTTNRHDIVVPDGVDDVTLTWSFHGDSLAGVIAPALRFARDLAALREDDNG